MLHTTDYVFLEPHEWTTDLERYLADLLIGHLRDDRWAEYQDDGLLPIRAPLAPPGFRTYGKGHTSGRHSSHVLAFTAPPLFELGIARKHLVILPATEYGRWSREHAHDGVSARLESLLRDVHGNARLYYPALDGYGTAKRLKMKRSRTVSREQTEAVISVLWLCLVAKRV